MNWHEYFLNMVYFVSTKSKDRSTKVGCVIVGPDNEIRSTGYNGFPRGVNDDLDERHERPAKYMWTEHAERNAIYNAARIGVSINKCTLYQDWWPCADCARAIVQSGITKMILCAESKKKGNKQWEERFGESMLVGKQILRAGGVKIWAYSAELECLIKDSEF